MIPSIRSQFSRLSQTTLDQTRHFLTDGQLGFSHMKMKRAPHLLLAPTIYLQTLGPCSIIPFENILESPTMRCQKYMWGALLSSQCTPSHLNLRFVTPNFSIFVCILHSPFHQCLTSVVLQRLAPFMSSIDGNDPPVAFNEKWLPFMIQSPIAGYIAILTSSYFQATARQIEWNKSVDVMAARVKLITLINSYLTAHQSALNDEAISTVMSLAYNEVFASETRSGSC
jgi:hypothetical protein